MRRERAADDYDTEQAIKLVKAQTGETLTVRQLQAWDQRKAVVASRRGQNKKRFYDFRGVRQLCIVARLLKAGLPPNRIREVIRGVERAAAEIDKTWDALRIVTDGQTVFVVDGDEGRDASTGQMASLILLGLLDKEARKLCQSKGRKKRAA
jgi:DNA-binding transcriptional MerR regulator